MKARSIAISLRSVKTVYSEKNRAQGMTQLPCSQEILFSPFPSEILVISNSHLNPTHLKIVDETPMGLTEQRPVLTSTLRVRIKPNRLYATHTIETYWIYPVAICLLKANFLLRFDYTFSHKISNEALELHDWSPSVCTRSLVYRETVGRTLH